MDKKNIFAITILSVLLSPLLGGIIGMIIGRTGILDFHHLYFEDGLVYVGTLAWIVASVLFYYHYQKK